MCDGAPSACAAICGDGLVNGTEACDDGDVDTGDGCSRTCTVESGLDVHRRAERVRDRVRRRHRGRHRGVRRQRHRGNGDGCSATCTIETGWNCTGMPSACAAICGDGLLRGAETCDDGWRSVLGATGGGDDGCSATCLAENGYTCSGTPSICGSTATYSGGSVAITDNATLNIDIVQTLACSVRAVSSVTALINHSFIGDLRALLLLPGGASLTVFDRPGAPAGPNPNGNSMNLGGTYSFRTDDAGLPILPELSTGSSNTIAPGVYAASDAAGGLASWSSAAGTSSGTWTLRIVDGAIGDTGNYSAVSIAYTCLTN